MVLITQYRLTPATSFSRDLIIVTRRTPRQCDSRSGVMSFSCPIPLEQCEIDAASSNVRGRENPLARIDRISCSSGERRKLRSPLVPDLARERRPRERERSQSFTPRFHLDSLCNFPTKLSLSSQITAAILVEHVLCVTLYVFRARPFAAYIQPAQ